MKVNLDDLVISLKN